MTYRAETYEKTFAGHEPLIAQHRAAGTGLLPAAVQLEMAMAGIARLGPFTPLELMDVAFLRPLTLADDATAAVRLDIGHEPGTRRDPGARRDPGTRPDAGTRFELSTLVAGERKQLSTGRGRPLPDGTTPGALPRVTGTRTIAPDDLYAGWSRAGLRYGPDFRTVRELTVGDGTARAVLRSDAEPMPWLVDPLLTDGVFQVVSCALQDPPTDQGLPEPAGATGSTEPTGTAGPAGPRPMLPIGVERIAVHTGLPASSDGSGPGVTVLVRRTGTEGAYATADAVLLGPSGEVAVEFRGVRMRRTTTLTPSAEPHAEPSVRPARGAQPISRIHWRPAHAPASTPAPGPEPGAAQDTWVVLHHGDATGEHTVRHLRAEGARVVEVGLGTPVAHPGRGPADRARDRDRLVLPHADEDGFRRLWEDVGTPVTGVVHLWNATAATGDEAEPAELRTGLYGCFAALKTLGERQRRSRFLVATRYAQPVADTDRPVPARAALWGLLRTAAIEYPGLRPRLVDLDDATDVLTAELGDGPTEVGYRQGVRHEPVRLFHGQDLPRRRPIRQGGRYLVLGGHGGLGLEVARRFAEEGAGLVALVSRSGGTGTAGGPRPAVTGPEGCAVASYAADVTAPGELRAVVERVRAEYGELHGVVHAAGTLKDGLIRSARAEDITAVMRPKADGVRELAAAVTGTDLDFAVLFASVSGTFGNLGQAGYAAANAYLDAFAHAHGTPWLSVDWGLWGEVGMGTSVADQLRRRGVRPLGTAEALDALIAVLGGDARQVVVAHPDGTEPEPGRTESGSGRTEPGPGGAEARPADGPDGVHAEAGRERVADELERFLAERLGTASVDRRAPFTDYGMSSIMSVELSEELSRRWDLALPATLFLEHGDFDALVEALTDRYGAAGAMRSPAAQEGQEVRETPEVRETQEVHEAREPGTPVVPVAPLAPPVQAVPAAPPAPGVPEPDVRERGTGRDTARSADIAVVAVSGDLPGTADVAGLWPLLRSGGHAFTEIPADRWDIDAHFEERGPRLTGTYCRTGAFLDDIDRFDPSFFGISVREAEEMDAQQKLLLEHAWAVRDESGLAGRRDIGVFIGATYTHHRDARGLDTVGPHTALGSLNAVLANRVSYALDLTGPSQTVDTLCSSSLVALQQAVAALRAGTCAAAIAGACHVGLTPWYYRSLSQLGALSQSLPRPFDDRADGFVPGEGAIAVMLKRLDDAERDGDRIHGVIRGVAVNHGGRGSALPVPRGEAQAAVVRAALDDAGLAPADISLIESHGTATRLGDPIEVAALTDVFGDDPDRRTPVHLGSVKANIGHLEPASGLAGLVKVLLCLRHGEIPPLAGYETPGAHLDLTGGPFVIPVRPLPWHSAGPRRAGISAFGMGGTNAHVVVEEYPAAPPAEAVPAPPSLGEHLLLLSAHTPGALARRATDLERLLRADPSAAGALCRTAAVGRDHLRYRAAVLGATADALRAGLAGLARVVGRGGDVDGHVLRDGRLLEGGTGAPDAALAARTAPFTSHTPERIAAQLRVPDDRLSTALAVLHVGGGKVDWRRVYEGTPARRVGMPPYPFRTEAVRGEDGGEDDTTGTVRRLTRAHRVFGEETVPGALTLALALGSADVLRRVAFVGRGTGVHALTSDLHDPARTGPVSFRYGGRTVARLETGHPHADHPDAAGHGGTDAHDLGALRAELGRTLDPEGLYAWFAAKGMDIDAPLRSLTDVRFGPGRVLARIDGSTGDGPTDDGTERTAIALDAALQSMAVLTLADPTAAPGTHLPVSVRRVVRRGDPELTAYVLLEAEAEAGADDAAPDGVRRGDATLLSADGRVLVRLEGVEYRTVTVTGGSGTAGERPRQHTPGSTPAPAPAPSPSPIAPGSARGAEVEASVLAVVRNVLHDPDVTPTTSLSSAGLDSMLATAVAADLEETHGVRLSPTDVLDAADCRALAARVAEQGGVSGRAGGPERALPPVPPAVTGTTAVPPVPKAPATPATPVAPVVPAPGPKDMAVIGIGLALPGARNPEELWSLLVRGGTATGPAPAHRWGAYAAGPESDVGGFLDDVEEFDARFFDLFPKQAEVLDPQARWLLRTTWEALESAGLAPRQVRSSTGVFVGASYQHYRDYNIAPELDAHSGLGNHNAFLANRLSHFLDLRGPSMTVDTLCSSSLVALHTAVRSIRDGECEQAVVAGVRIGLSPLHYVAMRNLRALSPSGASRAFDAAADGFVPGEGVVSLVVKPLAAALRDGDPVRGVIRGSAVNHGGRTSGLTVPSARGQRDVVVGALGDAGVSVESIGLVEAHGTGTGLGDPIEVEGLSRAWGGVSGRRQFCALGSLKSNVGHLEPAAGLAGVVKVLLAMERGVVPPTLHVVRPNERIRFEETPFYLAEGVGVWERGEGPRRGAVSAFGMGGVNAHVILEEAPQAPARAGAAPGSRVVRVTGADETAVRALAAAYADRFDTARDDWETADLCHTANVGRSPMEYRTAVTGRDAAELAAALRAVAAGRVPIARADDGHTVEHAPRDAAPAGAPHGPADVADVVALVRAGHAHVDWAALSPPGARITDLPTYPFAAQKHWHTHQPAAPANSVTQAAQAAPEPEEAPTVVAGRRPEALRVVWDPSAPPPPAPASGHTTVCPVTTDPALREALAAALRDRGAVVVETAAGADTVVVVDTPGRSAAEPPDLSGFWTELASLVKGLPAHGTLLRVGHHGVAVHGAERGQVCPRTAATAMAVRAACAESRKHSAVVDLDPADPVEARARQIAAEYAALPHGSGTGPGTEPPSGVLAAYRRGVRHVPRAVAAPSGPPYDPHGDGYYLVTGGLGAVGRQLIRRLVDRGARRIGVVGRSALDPDRSAELRELARRAEVAYLSCDVRDASALTDAARRFGARWGRLRGVVHCSGRVNPFGAMHRRPWSDAVRVTDPKITGSLNAVRLAQRQGADFAVLVSSIAGSLARAGRGLVDYSLANAYQLALAEREHGTATTVTAHAWPNWTGTGMEADASYSAAHSLGADEAADAFLDHLRSGGAIVFPGAAPTPARNGSAVPSVPADFSTPFAPADSAAPPAPALGLPAAAGTVEPSVLVTHAAPVRDAARPAAHPAGARARGVITAPAAGGPDHAVMRGHVRDAFVHVLGEDPGDRAIRTLGLDSLVIAELTTALEQRGGRTVDPSLLMRAGTADDLASALVADTAPPPEAPPAPAAAGEGPDGPPVPAPDTPGAPSALSALLHPLLAHDRDR
ncbi:SDR family NAD(P)-dependent oxidoreductase [Streptomyces prasinus]|uniref:SDR family NAD(P)-dependent oxidoreductase n=1 Tax=Streptomyces prasinus TaxID=67345 RepID=UPI0036C96606